MSAGDAAARFVFVQPHLEFGGAESQTVAIANALVRKGHDCVVVLHCRKGGLLSRLDRRVKVIDLGFESHFAVLLGAFRVRSVLANMPASLVIVRLWSSIMMAGSVAWSLKRHSFAFYEDLDPRDHADFIRFGRLKQAIIRRIFRLYREALVANTRHVAHAMVEAYGLAHEPRVITCGIEGESVRAAVPSRAAAPTGMDVLRIVTVGSLIERKGLKELLLAFESLHRPIEWTLVGDGPLRSWLLEQGARTRHVALRLQGGDPNPYRFIAAADVMVHGAKSESFGVVILEAIALGVPVAARDANGPREISEELPHALLELFDGDDPASLAAALDRLAKRRGEDGEKATNLGRFELAKSVEAWEQLNVI